MIARTARKRRAGFALLLVIGFNVMLLAVWSVAYRSVGSALQVEMSRSLRRTRDDGLMTALGQGVALLQYGTPTIANGSAVSPTNPFICSTESGFTVVYTPVPFEADGTTAQQGVWSVQVSAGVSSGTPAMPTAATGFPTH